MSSAAPPLFSHSARRAAQANERAGTTSTEHVDQPARREHQRLEPRLRRVLTGGNLAEEILGWEGLAGEG